MAHQVQVNSDGVELPDGNRYDSGATVTLTDHEFALIAPGAFTGGSPILTDLGHVAGTEDTLADLGDVDISDPQVGDIVKWTGSAWVNAQPAADIDVGGGGGGGGAAGLVNDFAIYGFDQVLSPITGQQQLTMVSDADSPSGSVTLPAATDIHITEAGFYVVYLVLFVQCNGTPDNNGFGTFSISNDNYSGYWLAEGNVVVQKPYDTSMSANTNDSVNLTTPPFYIPVGDNDFGTGDEVLHVVMSGQQVNSGGGGPWKVMSGSQITVCRVG